MTTGPLTGERPRYGATELKDSIQLYWMTGLGLAIAIHLAVIFSYMLTGLSGTADETGPYVKRGPMIWFPPPPLNSRVLENLNVSSPVGIRNRVGNPVPVPEGTVDPEQTLAPQDSMNPTTGPVPGGVPGGEGVEGPIRIPDEEPPPFRAVEVMPKIIRSVAPVYPDIALHAGLEGIVYVKIWVDSDGKPRKVSVDRSDLEVFNDEALAAAKQFLFTPAYMNSGPVSIWLTIPFRFRLADRK
jgi:TonB family protein